jgi:hypothetical protein
MPAAKVPEFELLEPPDPPDPPVPLDEPEFPEVLLVAPGPLAGLKLDPT